LYIPAPIFGVFPWKGNTVISLVADGHTGFVRNGGVKCKVPVNGRSPSAIEVFSVVLHVLIMTVCTAL
jgi:hypothetical protein